MTRLRLTKTPLAAAATALLASTLTATPAQAGALLDVYEKGLAQDKTLEAARYARDAAVEARPQALSLLLPQLSGTGSYSYDQTTQSYSTARFGSPQPVTVSQKSKTDGTSYGLNLTQTVFDWSAITKLRQSDDAVALAETTYRAAQQDLIFRTAQAYFNVLTAADTLRAAVAQNQAIGQQLEQFRQRFEVGLSAITDVQDAQARYDLTVATQLQAETALASAKRVLAQLTGSNDNVVTTVRDDLPLVGPDPQSPVAWAEAARKDNPLVLEAQLAAAIAERDVTIARAKGLPTVGLQGGYSRSDNNYTSNGATSPQSSYGPSVQAVLTVPIYTGGAIASGTRAANATYLQRQTQFVDAQRTAERSAGDAYQAVLTGISSVNAYRAAVISNRTAVEASQVGQQVGTRTAVDVLNAEQLLYAAESSYAQARYTYLLSVLQLKETAGRLTEQDLAEVDRLLVADAPVN